MRRAGWLTALVLLALTKPLDVAVGDQADGESEEGFVDVVGVVPSGERRRRKPCSQDMVRSTTQRKVPRPVPWGWPRSAIMGICLARVGADGTCRGRSRGRRRARPGGVGAGRPLRRLPATQHAGGDALVASPSRPGLFPHMAPTGRPARRTPRRSERQTMTGAGSGGRVEQALAVLITSVVDTRRVLNMTKTSGVVGAV